MGDENQNDEEMTMPIQHIVKHMQYDSAVKHNSIQCAEELENHRYMSPAQQQMNDSSAKKTMV